MNIFSFSRIKTKYANYQERLSCYKKVFAVQIVLHDDGRIRITYIMRHTHAHK